MRIHRLPCALFLLTISLAFSAGGATFPAGRDAGVDAGKILDEGWKLLLAGKIKEAEACFGKIGEDDPDAELALISLSETAIETGEDYRSFECVVKALEKGKWSPWMEYALNEAASLVRMEREHGRLERVLSKRMQTDDCSWLEEALVSTTLCRIREFNDFDKAEESIRTLDRARFARDWLLLGPFGNRDRGGFEEARDLENRLDKISLEEEFEGRGRKIKWFRYHAPWTGTLSLHNVFYPDSESLGYACTYVEAKEAIDATLALGAGGASLLWVNGQPVYKETTYHRFTPLQRLVPVRLRQGLNQIVIKVAGEQNGDFKLALRIVPLSPAELSQAGSAHKARKLQGNLRLGVADEDIARYADQPAVEKTGAVADGNCGLDWGALAYFSGVLKEDKDNPLALAAKAYFLITYKLDDGMFRRTRPLMDAAVKQCPDSPLILLFASYLQQDENEARELVKKAARVEGAYQAEMNLLDKELRGGLYRQAEQDAARLLALKPHYRVCRALGEVNKKREWKPEAHAQYRQAITLAPREGGLYLLAADTAGTEAEKEALLQQGLEATGDANLRLRLIGEFLRKHDFAAAEKLCRFHAAMAQDSYAHWVKLADCQRAGGDSEKALATMQEALAYLPQSPAVLEYTGKLLQEMGRQEEALDYFRRSLAIKTDNPELAELLKELEPKRKLFYDGYDIAYEDLSGRDAAPEDYPKFTLLTLLDQGFVKVNPNGTQSKMIHSVKKVLRREAIRQAAYEQIAYDPARQKVEVIRARVIQPDGSVAENAAIRDNAYGRNSGPGSVYSEYKSKSIQLPQVKEGSIVDIQYTVEDRRENIYNDEFETNFFFGSMNPTLRFDFTVILPKDKDVRHGQAGTEVAAAETTLRDGGRELRWRTENIPGIESEPMMPPYSEIVPSLRVSTFKDWSEVGKWVWNLSKEQMEIPADIKEKSRELVKDCKTHAEKVEAIYRFITKEIRYVSISFGEFGCKPHKAERTFRARYGDCKDTAVLFCAMLKEVGVDARLALVRTYNLGQEPTNIPGGRIFNHAIAYVPPEKEGGKHYWLDGTTDYVPFGEIPPMDRDTTALVVEPNGGSLIAIDPDQPENNLNALETRIFLSPGGKGIIAHREDFSGMSSAGVRRALEAPERLKQYLEMMTQSRFPGNTFGRFEHSSPALTEKDCWLKFSLEAPALAQKEGEVMKLKTALMPVQLTRQLASLKERKHDMVLGAPFVRRYKVAIALPKNARVVNLPKDINLEEKYASFTRKSAGTEKGVEIETIIQVKVRKLALADYAQWREFCNTVDSSQEEFLTYADGTENPDAYEDAVKELGDKNAKPEPAKNAPEEAAE
jgi:tetratricopeptide (TPR) repeat protein